MTVSREYVLDHLDELCVRAENGEEIVLVRPGKTPLALVAHAGEGRTAREAAEAIRQRLFMQEPSESINFRELIDEGRRY